MRLHRFYINEKIGERGEITLTDPELIHQLSKVFRFHNEDKVILFDGSGFEYEAEIVLISRKQIDFKILDKNSPLVKPHHEATSVSLYLSLIKKSNFELAAEKCTEVGVSEIHPIISERSDPSYQGWAGQGKKMERLNKIVKEASEQSGRMTLPRVFPVTPLELAVSQAVEEGRKCVVFHTNLGNQGGTLNREKGSTLVASTAVFVGPEGGWTEKEMELFKTNNFEILSLGENILRAETAAIVAVWNCLNNLSISGYL